MKFQLVATNSLTLGKYIQTLLYAILHMAHSQNKSILIAQLIFEMLFIYYVYMLLTSFVLSLCAIFGPVPYSSISQSLSHSITLSLLTVLKYWLIALSE